MPNEFARARHRCDIRTSWAGHWIRRRSEKSDDRVQPTTRPRVGPRASGWFFRAKLARLGLIERVAWLHTRYGGQQGWKLSVRMSRALRLLADKIDGWKKDGRRERREKDERLVGLFK